MSSLPKRWWFFLTKKSTKKSTTLPKVVTSPPYPKNQPNKKPNKKLNVGSPNQSSQTQRGGKLPQGFIWCSSPAMLAAGNFWTQGYRYIPRPSKDVKFQPQTVCFWWLRGSNFKPLEDSGIQMMWMSIIITNNEAMNRWYLFFLGKVRWKKKTQRPWDSESFTWILVLPHPRTQPI